MKHRISKVLSLLCLLAVLCGLSIPSALAANKYDDTEGHWAESSIQRWSDYNIVEGEDGSFKPNDSITRAQMAKVIANTLGLTEEAANSFTDVANDAWYATYILRCNAAGIILGDNGKANPNAVITRQEAMVMLARALEITPASESELAAFADQAQVEAWAAPYVAAMVKSGIVGGVDSNHVAPKDSMTRAEMMTVLDRSIVQYINKSGNYELTDKDGIVLVATGDVTLSGKTSADILVSSAAAGKALTFNKATVSGAINVQAANVNVVNNNSTLPEITVKNSATSGGQSTTTTTTTPATTPVSSGGGGGGGSNDLTVSTSKTISSGTYDSATITAAVGDGDVTLEGVTITGDLTIKGGGSKSVHLKDCTIGGKIIAAKDGGEQTLRVELVNTPVEKFEAQKAVIVEAKDSGSTIKDVDAKADLEVRSGNTTISNVSVPADKKVNLNVAEGNVGTVAAKGDVTVTGKNGKVDKVVAEADLKVSGENTAISTITVPAEKTVNLDVASGNVGTVEAKGNVTVTGENGKVDKVVAEQPVTVESKAVKNVEIPKTVTITIEITITGDEDVAVMVNGSEAVSIKAENGEVVSVSSDLDTPPTVKVNDKAVEHIHKWVVKVTKEASCSEVGEQTFTCSGCDEIKTEETAKIAHTVVTDAAVAATCIATGKTEGSHCSVCGEVLVEQEVTAKIAHTVVTDVAVEATCIATGKTEGSHCSVCGEVLVEQEVTDKIAHTPEVIPAKAASCTETGLTEGSKCSVCGEELVKQEETAKIAHTPEVVPAKAASCTETGLTEGSHCSVCNEVLVKQEVTDKIAHNYNEQGVCTVCGDVKTAEKDPTESGNGGTDKKPETSETLYGILVNGGNEAVSIFTSDGEVKDYAVPSSVIGYRTGDYVSYTLKGDEISSITVVDEPDTAHWKIGVVSVGGTMYAPSQIRDTTERTMNWLIDGTTYIVDNNTAVSSNVSDILAVGGHMGNVYYMTDDNKYYVRYVDVKSYTRTVTDAPYKDGSKVRVGSTTYNAATGLTFSAHANSDGTTDGAWVNLVSSATSQSKNSNYILYFNADDQVYRVVSDMDKSGESYFVKSVGENSVRVVGNTEKTLNIKDSDTLIYTDKGFIVPSELQVGDAIQTVGSNANLYKMVPTMTGTLTSTTAGVINKVKIGGTNYVYYRSYNYYDSDSDNSVINGKLYDKNYDGSIGIDIYDVYGNDVTFVLNKNNTVATIIVGEISASSKHYGIFVDCDGNTTSLGSGYVSTITIFTSEGKTVQYNINKDKKTAVMAVLDITYDSGSPILGLPIEYRLNKNGEVTSVVLFTRDVLNGQSMNSDPGVEIEIVNNAVLKAAGTSYTLSSNAIIFEVGCDNGDVDAAIVTRSALLNGDDFTPGNVALMGNSANVDKDFDSATYGHGIFTYAYMVPTVTGGNTIKALAYTVAKSHDTGNTLDENDVSDTMYGVVINTEGTSNSVAYTNDVVIYTSEGEQVQYSLGDFDKDEISKMVGKLVAYKVYSGTGRITDIDVVDSAINVNTWTDKNDKAYKLAADAVIFEVTADEGQIFIIKPTELKDDITTSDLSAKNGFWSTAEAVNIPAYAVFETNADGDIKALAYTVSPENASLPEANNETLYGILVDAYYAPLQYDIFTTDGITIRYKVSQNAGMIVTQISDLGKFVAYTLDKFGRISTIAEVDTSMTVGDKIIIDGKSLIDNDDEGNTYTLADDVVIIEVDEDDGDLEPKFVELKKLLKKSYIKPVDLYGWYDGTISAYAKYLADENGKIKVLVYTEDGGNSLQYGVVDEYNFMCADYDNAITFNGDDTVYELDMTGAYAASGAFVVYTQSGDTVTLVKSCKNKANFKTGDYARLVNNVSSGLIDFDTNITNVIDQEHSSTSATFGSVITNDSTLVYVLDASTGKFVEGSLDDVVKNCHAYVPVVDEDGYATVVLVDEYNQYD